MDMAFLNAANRADTFPPLDPWLSGSDINYYWLGHLAMAIVVKLTGVAPDRGYNLAVALILALTASAVFTVGGDAVGGGARGRGARSAPGWPRSGSCVVAGNLDGARQLIAHGGPLARLRLVRARRA